jgi:hypothetical protein
MGSQGISSSLIFYARSQPFIWKKETKKRE